MLRIWIKRLVGLLSLIVGLALLGWYVFNQIWPTDEFKTHFHSVIQLVIPIAFVVFGWKWLRYQGKGIDEITPPDLKCPEIDHSIEVARASLPSFLTEVHKGVDGCYVKFPFRSARGLLEHVWGYVHFHQEGRFNVTIANDLVDKTAGAENRIDIADSEIEDWQIVQSDGSLRGAYSLIALFRYHEGRGLKLSPKMMQQKKQLLDAT